MRVNSEENSGETEFNLIIHRKKRVFKKSSPVHRGYRYRYINLRSPRRFVWLLHFFLALVATFGEIVEATSASESLRHSVAFGRVVVTLPPFFYSLSLSCSLSFSFATPSAPYFSLLMLSSSVLATAHFIK